MHGGVAKCHYAYSMDYYQVCQLRTQLEGFILASWWFSINVFEFEWKYHVILLLIIVFFSLVPLVCEYLRLQVIGGYIQHWFPLDYQSVYIDVPLSERLLKSRRESRSIWLRKSSSICKCRWIARWIVVRNHNLYVSTISHSIA